MYEEYMRILKSQMTEVSYGLLVLIMKRNALPVLQDALCVAPTGHMDYETMVAILMEPNHREMLQVVLFEDDNTLDSEVCHMTQLMAFVERWEGHIIHWNKGEKGWTSPYGVYSVANKGTMVVRYINSLLNKYGVSNTRRDVYRLNDLLDTEEKEHIRRLVYELYLTKYTNKKVDKVLTEKGMWGTRIAVVNNSINGGLPRGMRGMQTCLGVIVDGKVGRKTLNALKQVGDDISFAEDNVGYMQGFYNNLVSWKPSRYKRFIRGWTNRVEALNRYIRRMITC